MSRDRASYTDEPSDTAREYIEPQRDTWTGLYNANGDRLHRIAEPIGFNPHRWSDPMKGKKKGKGGKRGC